MFPPCCRGVRQIHIRAVARPRQERRKLNPILNSRALGGIIPIGHPEDAPVDSVRLLGICVPDIIEISPEYRKNKRSCRSNTGGDKWERARGTRRSPSSLR